MIKKLLRSVREYKKVSILTPIIISIEVLMECIIPLIIARFVNLLDSMKNSETLVTSDNLMKSVVIYGLILVAMSFVSLLAGVVAAKLSAKASAGFATNLRKDLYYKIQDYSFTNIDKFSTASLVTRLTTDVTNVQMSYMMIIRTAVRSPLMLIFALALSFTYHPTLPLIFLIVVPILAIGLYFIIAKAHKVFTRVFRKYDNLNNSVQENIRGMRVVKSYVREDYEIEKFDKASSEVKKEFILGDKIIALNNPLMMFAIYACTALLSFLGAKIIIESGGSNLQIGDLTSLIQYSMQILMSLMMLSMVLLIITISLESAQRIIEILDEESTIKNPANPIYEVKDGSIDFENVSFKYFEKAEKPALKNINLHIQSGETIGILGGTGSSKTTLIQLIPRLYDVTEGVVKVAGIDVKEYDLETLRNEVAVVLQKNVLFSGTILENLCWGKKDATIDEIKKACQIAQASEFIESFPDTYNTYIEQGGTNVSGGQKQRLCIARALLKNPKILILDDSTSAVDTKTDALIRQGLANYLPETTKIIIAQRIASVENADKIIVMDNGEISGIGTHQELLASNKIYQEVYNSQNQKGGADNE